MTIEKDDKRLVFVPLNIATTPPPGLIEHLKDRYWAYDTERGLIYWKPNKKYPHPGAAQCNGSRKIAEHLNKQLYPWAQVLFVPSVFHKIDPRDFVS